MKRGGKSSSLLFSTLLVARIMHLSSRLSATLAGLREELYQNVMFKSEFGVRSYCACIYSRPDGYFVYSVVVLLCEIIITIVCN